MTTIVFLRGANLGKRRFSPKAVEKALADLDVVNVGAAGTFVVRKAVTQAALRARVASELPFEPGPMMLCSAKDLKSAVEAGDDITVPEGGRRFATILAKKPAKPKLPVEAPGIAVRKLSGRIALGTRRPLAETGGVYPNELCEKAFGTDATTRDWPTMEKVAKLL